MVDLTDALERKRLAKRLSDDVEAASIRLHEEAPRKHLGASIIGHECTAYAWNTFRWLKQEKFSGRMYRLFNRGHGEEERFVRYIEGAGGKVWEKNPETDKQFRIVGYKEHFGGSLDGIGYLPPEYGITEALLFEFKTHAEKSFTKLSEDLVVKSKPQHFAQMSTYGPHYQLRFGVYCAVNKNTDALHFEIIALDYQLHLRMHERAQRVIDSQTRPPKIAQTATFFTCKFCHFSGLCHGNEVPEVNCRSCVRASPVQGGQWFCERWGDIIPDTHIPAGCDQWVRIA